MRGSGAGMAFIHFPQIHSLDDIFTVRTLHPINEDRPYHTSITTISDLEGVQTLVFFFSREQDKPDWISSSSNTQKAIIRAHLFGAEERSIHAWVGFAKCSFGCLAGSIDDRSIFNGLHAWQRDWLDLFSDWKGWFGFLGRW